MPPMICNWKAAVDSGVGEGTPRCYLSYMLHDMNDSRNEKIWSTKAWVLLVALNAISAIVPGIFGVMGLIAPSSMPNFVGPVTSDITLFASLYGVRSVLLAITVLVLLATDRNRGGERLVPLLLLAAAIQVADIVLFIFVVGSPATAIGPAISVITHVVSAVLLERRARRLSAGRAISS